MWLWVLECELSNLQIAMSITCMLEFGDLIPKKRTENTVLY
jgi:hypothetical protein